MSDEEPQQEEEVPQEEEPQEEEPQAEEEEEEQAPAEEKEPEPEPEPQADPEPAPVADAPSGLDLESAWDAISSDKPKINWYCASVSAKIAAEFDRAGTGGLSELVAYLKTKKSNIIFALLRVNSMDHGGSKRAKFIFVRHVGSGVPVMKKAKLTPQLGKIADVFPVKHISLDSNEDCDATLDPSALTKEFLRVGGAHKPDAYEFGPGQSVQV
jgi:hypothetical protein